MRQIHLIVVFLISSLPVDAAELRVPQDYSTIQAAIDAARSGDVILVSPGTYNERITLTPNLTLQSTGGSAAGKVGLKRAEVTVIDGGGKEGDRPGVTMAEGCTLDGFTITRVGLYDDAVWKKHHQSQGEELDDEEGSVQTEGTIPAVRISHFNCKVINNIVHHNGDVGIAVLGSQTRRVYPRITENFCYRNMGGGIGVANFAEPVVRGNTCFENLRAGIGCRNANPLIVSNTCYGNIRAGIGCREGAKPLIRGNTCYRNRRAGIGIRMKGTSPVVEDNECYENAMAGIGNRDEASPVIRNNRCHHNKMAGIGSDGSRPVIIGNHSYENQMAGIGLRGGAQALIRQNRCLENRLVAIGVTQGSTATIQENQLKRTGGVPPLVAIKDGSTAIVQNNTIHGGGVAGVLVQGTASISGNTFVGVGGKQGSAVWVWKTSVVTVSENRFTGYRNAVNASGAEVTVNGNRIQQFQTAAIIVKESTSPAHVFGNQAVSDDPKAVVLQITGASGIIDENELSETD